MVQTQQTNPHQRFENITNKILKEDQNIVLGLEDILRASLVEHTAAHKENHGEGLGEAMYAKAEAYIIDTMYPALKGELDENSKEVLEERMRATLGLKKQDLLKLFEKKKTVHQAEISGLINEVNEHVAKNLQGMRIGKFARLADDDLPGTKAYLKSLAGELKIESYDDTSIVGPKGAAKEYQRLISLLAKTRGMAEGIKNYKVVGTDTEE